MSLNFVKKVPFINGDYDSDKPQLQFYERGFMLNNDFNQGYQDVTVSGNNILSLPNAKAGSPNYVKAYGGCEQTGTPSPDNIMPIVCNNGVLKVKNLFDADTIYSSYKQPDGSFVMTGSNANQTKKYIPEELVGKQLTFSAYIRKTTDSAITNVRVQAVIENQSKNGNNINSETYTQSTVTFTPTSTTDYIHITYSTPPSSTMQVKDIQLETGSSATTYVPYGQVIADGTVEKIEVRSENVINTSMTRVAIDSSTISTYWPLHKDELFFATFNLFSANWIVGANITSTSNLYNSNCRTFSIPCKAGDVFIAKGFNGFASASRRKCSFVDSTGVILTAVIWENNNSFTAPGNAVAFLIEWGLDDTNIGGWVVTKNQAMPSSYVSYYNGGSATCENLLAVDTYKDVQSILDGSVTRNVKVKVLDSSEIWSDELSISGRVLITILDMLSAGAQRKDDILTTHFKFISSGHSVGGCFHYSKAVYFYPPSTITTLDAWKTWLVNQYNAGTPVIIVYPLATATTETVTGQTLTLQEGNNTIEISQASLDTLGLEVSYKAGVSVTVEEIEAAQLDNSVTVTIS